MAMIEPKSHMNTREQERQMRGFASSAQAQRFLSVHGQVHNLFRAGTYLAWFRAVAKKYPHKRPAEILEDLVSQIPGEEGKWFATAKEAKLCDEAVALANRTPHSPQTLTRAARDFDENNPEFAIEAGMAALHWLAEAYGYEITGLDVLNTHPHTMKAAENAGRADETRRRIHDLVARETCGEHFVTKLLGRQLGIS